MFLKQGRRAKSIFALAISSMRQPIIFFLSFILFAKIAFAEDNNNSVHLVQQLSGDFKDYYNSVNQDNIVADKEKLIFNIKHLLGQCGFAKEELSADSIEELQNKINHLLKGNKKEIVLFLMPDSDIVNCWLGDSVEEKRAKKDIWGKEIDFIVKVMDNLEIRDFTYFLSKGMESLDVGTRGDIIFYNLEAYKMRAASIWNFFADRENGKKDKRYDSSKSNRLRKWLYYRTWPDLYMECIKNSLDSAEARIKFIDQAVGLLKENSLFHEIGHIFAGKHLRLNDESEEEIIAFLSELRYGPLPYESLETIIAASYKSSMDGYNSAGRYLTSGFISYIKNEQKNKNSGYKNINIRGKNRIEKSNNLYKLNEEQIRAISEHMFNQITQGGMING